ncbi:protein disulfide isomerase4 [Zea mays]|uniref:Protein disulfide isomerase4 n=1 Tax=Zea mays TaxID=4577 RepID=A0A1D6GXN4_MAIZE|nr:protein disulfide isomerase4 [Zea mays]
MHTIIRDAATATHDFIFYADRLIRLVSCGTWSWSSSFSGKAGHHSDWICLHWCGVLQKVVWCLSDQEWRKHGECVTSML